MDRYRRKKQTQRRSCTDQHRRERTNRCWCHGCRQDRHRPMRRSIQWLPWYYLMDMYRKKKQTQRRSCTDQHRRERTKRCWCHGYRQDKRRPMRRSIQWLPWYYLMDMYRKKKQTQRRSCTDQHRRERTKRYWCHGCRQDKRRPMRRSIQWLP